jgi:4-amino-4-deoxy-L-arabinose transferase-like glycosyltransferase
VIIETTRRFFRKDNWQPGYLLAVCWVGVYVITFSLARTKLANYITPCYPAAALLIGAFVERWIAGKLLAARWWPALSFGTLALVGGGMIFGGYVLAQRLLPGEQALGLIGLLPLAAGIIALVRHLFDLDRRWTAGILTAAFIPMTTLIFSYGAQRVDTHRQDQVLISQVVAQQEKPALATFRILEPSWVYYAKQPIAELARPLPKQKSLLDRQTVLVAQMNDYKQAVQFFAKNPDGYLITTRANLAELQPHLPADLQVIAEQPRFLKDGKLVAIGRPKPNLLAEKPGSTVKPQR